MNFSKMLIICCALFLLFSFVTSVQASEDFIETKIPNFKIKINNQPIVNEQITYPFFEYKNITYLPLTWDLCNTLGLKAKWTSEKGLSITQNTPSEELQELSLDLTNTNINGKHLVSLPNFNINLEGKIIDNSTEEYPFLFYLGITYLPLTWEIAVEKLGFQLEWYLNDGLNIKTKFPTEKFDDVIEEPVSALQNEYLTFLKIEKLWQREFKQIFNIKLGQDVYDDIFVLRTNILPRLKNLIEEVDDSTFDNQEINSLKTQFKAILDYSQAFYNIYVDVITEDPDAEPNKNTGANILLEYLKKAKIEYFSAKEKILKN